MVALSAVDICAAVYSRVSMLNARSRAGDADVRPCQNGPNSVISGVAWLLLVLATAHRKSARRWGCRDNREYHGTGTSSAAPVVRSLPARTRAEVAH
jgi:hypothetical protein